MTLILTHTTLSEVLHVSDRQVTRLDRTGKKSIHSPVENKSIIFTASDAICALGYTGSAYVGKTPTDQWLAELIMGKPMQGAFALSGGAPPPFWSLNDVVWRIKSALAAGAMPRRETLSIDIAGFRQRRRYFAPFLIRINWPSGNDDSVMRLPRRPEETHRLSAIGDPPPKEELDTNFEIGAAMAAALGEHRRIGGLAYVIRSRSQSSFLVGPNLMAIRISIPERVVEWEFKPALPHIAAIKTGRGEQVFEAVYSPWIVTRRNVLAPSLGNIHPTVRAGDWQIRPVERAPGDPDDPLKLIISSQRRVARPC